MLRATRSGWTHDRRCALIGASAAVLCLGGALAACGGGDGGGYVATGAAGGPPRVSGTAVAPTGNVTLVPLDGDSDSDSDSDDNGGGDDGRRSAGPRNSPTTAAASGTAQEAASPGASDAGAKSGPVTVSPSAPTVRPTASPTGPAALLVGEPVREAADERWCEDVTMAFHNTGSAAVRSGTVTFGTHVIGALGVDWATVESAEKLPAPIGPGARKRKTWTVCVDAWRVPWGTHVETRDVSVRWE